MTRLSTGGLIDRDKTLHFTFDGVPMIGHPGDTLASALLANGRHFVARSIKYHRPRGILSAGLEEPCALLSVTDQFGATPNLKATEVTLQDGLTVTSQIAWPSLNFDAGVALQLGGKMLSAGFYYKTFKWPREAWHKNYARIIRCAAGHGRVDLSSDPNLYDKRHTSCEVLIIGSGAAGLSAALCAGRTGASTILLEQDQILGGSLLQSCDEVEGVSAADWVSTASEALEALPNVTVMPRTLAFGLYDHGLVQAVETRMNDTSCRAIMWKIRARQVILSTGAIERPIVFAGNDRPGIMLANAVRTYIRRFAVSPGQRAIVAVADKDERDDTVDALKQAGIEITAILDPGSHIIKSIGSRHVTGLKWRGEANRHHQAGCDLVCVSGGWMPTAHLFAQLGNHLEFSNQTQSLLPANTDKIVHPVGGARGVLGVEDCIADARAAAQHALSDLGLQKPSDLVIPSPTPSPQPGYTSGPGMCFVDLQNDVTRADVGLAQREGYHDVELTKRYTTLGMGTDQGKTSWTNGVLEIASVSGGDAKTIGHTTYRPPYSPVSIGALVGSDIGANMTPTRRTPFHNGLEDLGCVFQTSGDWLYSRYFPQPNETMTQAIQRECKAVRSSLGYVDMSTLGKFDIQGPDALEFLSRLYCNGFATLKPGRLRYGLMLREDGYVFDDGTIARLGKNHYLVTATTANSSSVWRHMRKLSLVDWPELDVTLTRASDHWASLAIAGPNARNLLQALSPDFDCAHGAFPFASVRDGKFGGNLPVRVFSVSFSGELSFEINTPAGYAGTLLNRVMKLGKQWNITPYGLETLDVLRIEKGHLSIGTEIDGRRTPDDLNLGNMVSKKKLFLGGALLQRPALQRHDREQLVGLQPVDGHSPIPIAAHLSEEKIDNRGRAPLSGHLTAAIDSPTLGYPIALAFLKDGQSRIGEELWAHSPIAGTSMRVQVTPTCAYDPKGDRLNG